MREPCEEQEQHTLSSAVNHGLRPMARYGRRERERECVCVCRGPGECMPHDTITPVLARLEQTRPALALRCSGRVRVRDQPCCSARMCGQRCDACGQPVATTAVPIYDMLWRACSGREQPAACGWQLADGITTVGVRVCALAKRATFTHRQGSREQRRIKKESACAYVCARAEDEKGMMESGLGVCVCVWVGGTARTADSSSSSGCAPRDFLIFDIDVNI
jgi:hypothetical protein